MLHVSSNGDENSKKSLGIISKKNFACAAWLFLYISLPLFCTTTTQTFQNFPSYTVYGRNVVHVCTAVRSFLLPLIFTLVVASISHFFTTAIKVSCFSSSNYWSQTEQTFWINSALKARLQNSVLACLLVRTLEWQKIFFGDWTCNKLSVEKPQGTPGPFTGPEGWRMWSTFFHFWQATPRHFFYRSCPQTAHSQCNWSCLWRSLCCHMANKAWFMFSFT